MKKAFHILLFFWGFTASVFAQLSAEQETRIDSLQIIIHSGRHDTVKINAYKNWDDIIYVSDPKLDEELNQKIIDLANRNLIKESLDVLEKRAFENAKSLAINSLGIIFYNKGEFEKAIIYYMESLKIREEMNDRKGIAATLNNLGIVYQEQADYFKAINCYTRCLKIYEEITDKIGEANCLSNIGRVYFEQGEIEKSVEYQNKGLEIRKAIGDKRGLAIAYNNLGSIYFEKKNMEYAIEYFNRYLNLSRELGDKTNIALALSNMGSFYERQSNEAKALEYYQQSLMIVEEIGNKKWIASLLNEVGGIYYKNGEFLRAIGQYQKSLRVAKSIGAVVAVRDASQSLFKCYKSMGRYQDALKMHEFFMTMRDSVVSENNQKEILKQELKYNYEKQKAIDLKDHEKELAVSNEREQKQKIISYLIAIGLILIAVFAIFVFNRLRFSERQKRVIETQNYKIVESINYSKKIQDSLLPSIDSIRKQLPNLFVYNAPKDTVSGDFYFFKEYESFVLIACVDCTGHGVPGGFMSTVGSLLLDKITDTQMLKPSEILNQLNDQIIRVLHQQSAGEIQDGMDLSVCLVDKLNKKVEFSGARNGIIIVSNEEAKRYKANPLPVGGNYIKKGKPISRNFETTLISVNSNDWIYMYTDGYVEQIGGLENVPMSFKQFESRLIQLSQKQTFDEKKYQLKSELDNWRGSIERTDDVLIIGFQVV
jgi:tetratricopeptide (TPR) repeat protein